MPGSPLENLAPALIQTFFIILVGYTTGSAPKFPDGARIGIEIFVADVTLPCCFFIGLAKVDFQSIDWGFFNAVLLGKTFVVVLVLTWTICTSARGSLSSKLSLGSIRCLFCTLQNDFALGIPVFQALYGQTNPDFIDYMYLVAPISICFINPIMFTLLEFGLPVEPEPLIERENSETYSYPNQDTDTTSSAPFLERNDGVVEPKSNFSWRTIGVVLRRLMTTPVVLVVPFGFLANFLFHQHPPALVTTPLKGLADGYSSSALFAIGLSMAKRPASQEKEKEYEQPITEKDLTTACLLILIKILVLPIVTLIFFLILKPNCHKACEEMAVAVFIYGTFPTAPSVDVFASKYGVSTKGLAPAVLLCTFTAGPFAFVSANMAAMVMKDSDTQSQLLTVLAGSSNVGLISGVGSFVTAVTILARILVRGRKGWIGLEVMLLIYALACTLTVISNQLNVLHLVAKEDTMPFFYGGCMVMNLFGCFVGLERLISLRIHFGLAKSLHFIMHVLGIAMPVLAVWCVMDDDQARGPQTWNFYGDRQSEVFGTFMAACLVFNSISLALLGRWQMHQLHQVTDILQGDKPRQSIGSLITPTHPSSSLEDMPNFDETEDGSCSQQPPVILSLQEKVILAQALSQRDEVNRVILLTQFLWMCNFVGCGVNYLMSLGHTAEKKWFLALLMLDQTLMRSQGIVLMILFGFRNLSTVLSTIRSNLSPSFVSTSHLSSMGRLTHVNTDAALLSHSPSSNATRSRKSSAAMIFSTRKKSVVESVMESVQQQALLFSCRTDPQSLEPATLSSSIVAPSAPPPNGALNVAPSTSRYDSPDMQGFSGQRENSEMFDMEYSRDSDISGDAEVGGAVMTTPSGFEPRAQHSAFEKVEVWDLLSPMTSSVDVEKLSYIDPSKFSKHAGSLH